MMIPISWRTPHKITNLPQLLENYRAHGGQIIEYKRVWSCVAISLMTPQFKWVAPGQSRIYAGLSYSLFSAALGWWSITGVFWTPMVLIQNFMGGIDVTRVLAEPPLPGQPYSDKVIQELKRAEFIQNLVIVGMLFLALALIIVFLVLPSVAKLR